MLDFKKSKSKTAYGTIRYSSINIGDEIQSLAAMRFLPQVDYYIPRERIDEFKAKDGERVRVIMNAWWMWDASHFPPSEDIDPLFVSFHLREAIRGKFFTEEVTKYLKKHAPIGCRDTGTVSVFQNNGIDAYYTGCMTATLLPNYRLKDKFEGGNYIVCVDVPQELVKIIEKRADKPVYDISRMMSPAFTSLDRFRVAKYMLFVYHNAACVVTPRLHAALPATAFHTPVCMIKSERLPRNGRFDGMAGLFNEVVMEEYFQNRRLYDINNPPENPDDYTRMSEGLISRCREFTGHDNKTSIFEDSYNPLLDMTQILAYDKKVINRILMFADEKDLVAALNSKVVKKQSRHDLKY